MARISLLTHEQMDPELAELVDAGEKTPLELGTARIYGHVPDLAKGLIRFLGSVRAERALPPRLVELVRLRVAFHNQCRSCMAIRYQDGLDDGVTEDLVCQLADPPGATDLTNEEKSAIAFADMLASNHLAIDDQTIDELREHFTEAEIVELGMNVAAFVGFGRLAMAWDMVDELPDEYRDRSGAVVTPWSGDPIII
jgi:AhpD family alkylhydroperoxidase